jgi:23S rRNA-/tRNA-specific pseudouridylate synthase
LPQLNTLLVRARRTQASLQQQALDLAFRQRDAAGQRVRQDPAAFAPAMGLPADRCERLLASAIKATPLPGDPEPVEVIFEDEHLIAVNKPPHLRSHPIHRYAGGSVLNRLITHLDGVVPRVRGLSHHGDLSTL